MSKMLPEPIRCPLGLVRIVSVRLGFIVEQRSKGNSKALPIGAEKAYDEQASRYPAGRVSNSAGLIILYKADRFDLLGSGSQRYSSTELQERHYQWAKFTDAYTGETVFMTILGNESELHIDNIFVNTERVEVVIQSFLNDRIVLDDGEHRYSDHDPFVVMVMYK